VTEEDSESISLQEAADRLGVHYMTAYRYVRTGRLAATRVGGQWMVDPAALPAAAHGGPAATGTRPPGRVPGTARGSRDPGRAIAGLGRSLVRGDEAAVWQQVQDQLAYGTEPEALYLQVLGPVMHAIGEAWAAGELDVGEEHQASTVMQRVLGRLGPLFATRGRKRGTIVIGAPPRERHSLPIALLADPLRGRHFEVVDLGADVPVGAFADATVRADRLLAVGVCATTASARSIRETVAALHAATTAPVVLGGAAVASEQVATRLGADHFSAGAGDALAIFESLATGGR
jgi:excisionase family DNA binding protein